MFWPHTEHGDEAVVAGRRLLPIPILLRPKISSTKTESSCIHTGMSNEYFTLRQASEILRVKPHIITYVLATQKVKEPLRVGGRRMFTHDDLAAIGQVLKSEVILDLQRRGQNVAL